MSATNATTNYSLPLFIGTDKPAWLVDWNTAMTDIDGQMKVNATAIQANATSISGLSTTVSAHTTSISTISGEISTLTTGLNSAQGAINTIQSLIGNGEPTTTDKTLIGAINEIYGMITGGANEIEAENVAYDNTSSGLTATDVQAAIDELAQGGSATVEADDVTYDNTSSGLTATNVQAAIDEVAAIKIEGGNHLFTSIATSTSETYAVTFTKPYTSVPAIALSFNTHSGDSPTGLSTCFYYASGVTTTGFTITIRNTGSANATNLRIGYVVYGV